MKKILYFLFLYGILPVFSNAQETVNCYPEITEYSTGYITDTEKFSGNIQTGQTGFLSFDLSAIPNHASVQEVVLHYFIAYTNTVGEEDARFYNVEVNPIEADFETLQSDITGTSDKLGEGITDPGENYGSTWNTLDFNEKGLETINQALLRDWVCGSFEFSNGDFQIVGYDEETTKPYLEVTYENGIPATDLAISTASGETTISTSGGSLQLVAEISPENVSIDSVQWSITSGSELAGIDKEGLLTAAANGNGNVTVKATTIDDSGIFDEIVVEISNQTAGIISNNQVIKIYPNPCNDILKITGCTQIAIFELYSIEGKKLLTKQLPTSKTKQINLNKLKAGTYILVLKDKNSILVREKIFIE